MSNRIVPLPFRPDIEAHIMQSDSFLNLGRMQSKWYSSPFQRVTLACFCPKHCMAALSVHSMSCQFSIVQCMRSLTQSTRAFRCSSVRKCFSRALRLKNPNSLRAVRIVSSDTSQPSSAGSCHIGRKLFRRFFRYEAL